MTNIAIIIGRTTKDIELQTTNSGKNFVRFSIAQPKNEKDKDGDANFFTVLAWGKTAEFLNKYVPKGRKICVNGRLDTNSYTTKEGIKKVETYIVAENIEVLDSINGEKKPSDKEPKPQVELTPIDDSEHPF